MLLVKVTEEKKKMNVVWKKLFFDSNHLKRFIFV